MFDPRGIISAMAGRLDAWQSELLELRSCAQFGQRNRLQMHSNDQSVFGDRCEFARQNFHEQHLSCCSFPPISNTASQNVRGECQCSRAWFSSAFSNSRLFLWIRLCTVAIFRLHFYHIFFAGGGRPPFGGGNAKED